MIMIQQSTCKMPIGRSVCFLRWFNGHRIEMFKEQDDKITILQLMKVGPMDRLQLRVRCLCGLHLLSVGFKNPSKSLNPPRFERKRNKKKTNKQKKKKKKKGRIREWDVEIHHFQRKKEEKRGEREVDHQQRVYHWEKGDLRPTSVENYENSLNFSTTYNSNAWSN